MALKENYLQAIWPLLPEGGGERFSAPRVHFILFSRNLDLADKFDNNAFLILLLTKLCDKSIRK
jgi:hypothetical protein